MSDDEAGEIMLPARQVRTRRGDHGVRGAAERVVESVWTRLITRGAMIVLAVLGYFAVDKVNQFTDQLHDVRADQRAMSGKIEDVQSALDQKMGDVIANQAAGLADRNAQAGQIADLKEKINDVKADLTKQVDALGTRMTNIGNKLFDMKGGMGGSGEH